MSHAATLRTIAQEVSEIYLERRGAIEAIMLAVLSKEHVFVLGPPGTGKSAMAREMIERFTGSSYFETLLSKLRPDQAVLGPWDLPLLKEGEFQRRTGGYLPTANFAFLDEIGKMSSTLGHDLLAVLNERILHQVTMGSRSTIHVPLYTAITASNELIVQESEDAAALWDRLLIRAVVDNIQETGAFTSLLRMDDNARSRTTISFGDLQHVIDTEVPAVKLTDGVIDVVVQLREALREQGITVSDRRWRQCMKVLRASAYLNDRDEVNDDDVHTLRYCLWDGPDQKKAVERLCLQVSNPLAEKVMALSEDAEAIAREVRAKKGQSIEARSKYGIEANGKLKLITSDIAKVKAAMVKESRSTISVDEVSDRVAAIKTSIMTDLLDMDA